MNNFDQRDDASDADLGRTGAACLNDSAPEQLAAPTQPEGEALKQAAKDVGRVVQDNAQETLAGARRGAERLLDQQKAAASEHIEQFARAVGQAGECVAEQNPHISRLLDETASRLGAAGAYVRNNNLGTMLNRVDRFGREHPLILLGGMFLAGALTARFLKASQRRLEGASEGSESAERQAPLETAGARPWSARESTRAATEAGPRPQPEEFNRGVEPIGVTSDAARAFDQGGDA